MAMKIQALQKAAFFTHGFQALTVFVLWIVILVLKAQKGASPSQANVLFAMCFLAVPIIIYTAMTPRWPRTVKYSHPIAQAVLCGVSAIIWFIGFVALAVHNNNGISKGEKDGNKSCATTVYGTPRSCEISKAAIGIGAVVFIEFAVTTGMYGYTCYYLWNNNLTFTSHLRPEVVAAHDVEATTQDAFSHKDDQMLEPEEDEHDQTHLQNTGAATPATPGGVYAPLSGTAVGAGRWQGEDDDDDDDYRRPPSVVPQNGRQTPYSDQPQQVLEFPDGPYNRTY